MKWNKKNKTKKVDPELGDFKRRVRFAFFPLKIDNKIVWWEKYIKVWEFKRNYHREELVVSSGLLEDAFTTTGLTNTRTVTRTTPYNCWRYSSREFLINPNKTK